MLTRNFKEQTCWFLPSSPPWWLVWPQLQHLKWKLWVQRLQFSFKICSKSSKFCIWLAVIVLLVRVWFHINWFCPVSVNGAWNKWQVPTQSCPSWKHSNTRLLFLMLSSNLVTVGLGLACSSHRQYWSFTGMYKILQTLESRLYKRYTVWSLLSTCVFVP